MVIKPTALDGVFIIEPETIEDNRGYFSISFTKRDLDFDIKEENKSFNARSGTIRGLHLQNSPHSQSKLISCLKGRLIDIAVDLRKDSKTYKKWISVELSEDNLKQIFIPKGFAHGFITLEDNTELEYKVDDYYSESLDRSIRYDDPDLGINWKVKEPIISEKDKLAPLLKDCDIKI